MPTSSQHKRHRKTSLIIGVSIFLAFYLFFPFVLLAPFFHKKLPDCVQFTAFVALIPLLEFTKICPPYARLLEMEARWVDFKCM